MNVLFNGGIDELHSDWATGSFIWLLATNTYVPDPDHDFIADVTGEVTVTSYSRVAPSSPTRAVSDTTHLIEYRCDSPDFGNLEDTEAARWLILARVVTNDADSRLICALDLGEPVTLGTGFVVHLHPSGFAASRQVIQ